MVDQFIQGYQHLLICITMMIGLYIVMAHDNLIKKILGVGLMQSAVFTFFILGADLYEGSAPILDDGSRQYVNPLPHVLILTAIVVNVASAAMGLALAIGIDRLYKNLDESNIDNVDERSAK